MERNVIIKTEGIKQERVDFGGYKSSSTKNVNQFFKNETKFKIDEIKPKNGTSSQATVKQKVLVRPRYCHITICSVCQKKCYTSKKYRKHYNKFHAHDSTKIKISPKPKCTTPALDHVKEETKFDTPTNLRTYSRKKTVVPTNDGIVKIKDEIQDEPDVPDLEKEWLEACLEHMK